VAKVYIPPTITFLDWLPIVGWSHSRLKGARPRVSLFGLHPANYGSQHPKMKPNIHVDARRQCSLGRDGIAARLHGVEHAPLVGRDALCERHPVDGLHGYTATCHCDLAKGCKRLSAPRSVDHHIKHNMVWTLKCKMRGRGKQTGFIMTVSINTLV